MRRDRQRGAALLIALGAAAVIAALAAAALPAVSGQARLADRAQAQAQAARLAQAAVHRVIAALGDAGERAALPRDGAVLETEFLGARLTLAVQDAAGLVDLNAADPATLAALLRVTGAPAPAAARIARRLAAARRAAPDRRAFAAPEAAAAALSPADAALLRAATPYLTVWSGAPTVSMWTAPAPALAAAADGPLAPAQAYVLTRAALGAAAPPPTFDARRLSSARDSRRARVTATVETEGGGRAQATAVVETSPDRPRDWRILAWR